MAYLEYFSPARLALQKELEHHPDLWPYLAKHPPAEFELRLAEVAAYCEIILDGYYSPDDLDALCYLLVKKLYEKRTLIILS